MLSPLSLVLWHLTAVEVDDTSMIVCESLYHAVAFLFGLCIFLIMVKLRIDAYGVFEMLDRVLISPVSIMAS